MPEIQKVLIANRGEIACRIISTCRAMGIASVAVHSEADEGAAHVAMADESYPIGPAAARDSYLRADRIIDAARRAGADAIHPGYGFLSESPDFARAVQAAGLIWIGPEADIIERMGDKDNARRLAREAGVPVLEGSRRFAAGDTEGLEEEADRLGFPLLVKAAAGGGGIGMRRVDAPGQLAKVVEATQTMAERSFGDGTIYLERFVARARHVEVQVFGFGNGTAIHLFDRDCSVQRRFQKVIEEAPAPGIPDPVRQAMLTAAVNLAEAVDYAGAGTVEFIYDLDRRDFSFLEMNTRIQVEHPATEMVTGIDLVRWQIEQAAGRLSPVPQSEPACSGHAVEARIYAERPEKNFLPSPGRIDTLDWPETGAALRIDTALRPGDEITPFYDPMIAKVIATGPDRAAALEALGRALAEVRITGVSTNVDFLRRVLADPTFREAGHATSFISEMLTTA